MAGAVGDALGTYTDQLNKTVANRCRFKNALGEPRKGIHALRIPGIDFAAADVALTFLLALIIAWITVSSGKNRFFRILYRMLVLYVVLFFVGQIFHVVFCVETKFTKATGLVR